jgi:hypothetical protein
MGVRRTPWRWGLPAAAMLLLAGGALLAWGLLRPGGGPHAQPLPARPFAIDPAAARLLPAPPPLASPQPGSIQAACTQLPAGQPQVTIRSLCIDAPLVATHVAGGALLIPADVHLAALDTGGAALNARQGTTIIAGHVDNVNQGYGSFYFLYQVEPGAVLTVTGLDHTVTTWRVYQTAVAAKTALPLGIWSRTGSRQLVLVTCGGPIEHTQSGNTYQDNILIYATPDALGHPHGTPRLSRRNALRSRATHLPL